MAERWSYPVPQAMQRHTGCRFVAPKTPSPPTVPGAGDATGPSVVPAKAGTHTPQSLDKLVAMGPGSRSLRSLARDDSK
jgi:hypothetical protein